MKTYPTKQQVFRATSIVILGMLCGFLTLEHLIYNTLPFFVLMLVSYVLFFILCLYSLYNAIKKTPTFKAFIIKHLGQQDETYKVIKVQCKFCRKRTELRIEKEIRIMTNDEKTCFCSACGKQLFILGGFWEKPFWIRPFWALWLVVPDFITESIWLWERFKTAVKEADIRKLIFILIPAALLICTLLDYLAK